MNSTPNEQLLRDSSPHDPRRIHEVAQRLFQSATIDAPAHYELGDELGRGQFGRVFKAYDSRLSRTVALKIIRCTSETQQARLDRESYALAQLSHPHIVQVYEKGTFADNLYFLAMELVEGSHIHDWARQQGRTLNEILAVFADVARGLHHAHEHRLIHRDIKPSNIVVDHDGRCRILDFGLVRLDGERSPTDSLKTIDSTLAVDSPPLAESNSSRDATNTPNSTLSLTNTGSIVGTPHYAAPEQLRGEPVDARSDQFSFCVTLFEAVYGYRPFSGRTTIELAQKVETGQIDTTRPPLHRIPQWLKKLLLRGLEADPNRRHKSLQDIAATIRRRTTPSRSRLLYAALGAGAAATVVAGAAYLLRPAKVTLNWDGAWPAQVSKTDIGDRYGPGMLQSLDIYERSWKQALNQYTHSPDARADSPQIECLDNSKSEFRTFVTGLHDAEKPSPASRLSALGDRIWLTYLFAPEDCLVEQPEPIVQDKTTRKLLTDAEQAGLSGQYSKAIQLLEQARRRLIDEGRSGKIIGLVGYKLGTMQMYQGDPRAWNTLANAERDNGGDDEFIIDVMTRRIETQILRTTRSRGDIELLANEIQQRSKELGSSYTTAHAYSLIVQGHLSYLDEDYSAARDHYTSARTLLEENNYADQIIGGRFLVEYCILHEAFMSSGKVRRTVDTERVLEALAAVTEFLGAANPLSFRYAIKVAYVLERAGEAEKALELLRKLPAPQPHSLNEPLAALDAIRVRAEMLHLNLLLEKIDTVDIKPKADAIAQELTRVDPARVPGNDLYRVQELLFEARAMATDVDGALTVLDHMWTQNATPYAQEVSCGYFVQLRPYVEDRAYPLSEASQQVAGNFRTRCSGPTP